MILADRAKGQRAVELRDRAADCRDRADWARRVARMMNVRRRSWPRCRRPPLWVGDRRPLHAQVDLDVAVRRRQLSMAQPCSDGGDVYAGAQQVHRGGVAKDVGRDVSRVSGRKLGVVGGGAKQVGDPRARQSLPSGVEEQGLIEPRRLSLGEPRLDGHDGA